jgi:hypothetical protein
MFTRNASRQDTSTSAPPTTRPITEPIPVMAAKIAVAHSATGAEIARDIDDAEAKLRAAVPAAKYVFLEPDIDRGAS